MKTIIVTPENDQEFSFLQKLLRKLGYDPQVLYEDDKEDHELLKAMVKEKKGEYVSEDEILKALGRK